MMVVLEVVVEMVGFFGSVTLVVRGLVGGSDKDQGSYPLES